MSNSITTYQDQIENRISSQVHRYFNLNNHHPFQIQNIPHQFKLRLTNNFFHLFEIQSENGKIRQQIVAKQIRQTDCNPQLEYEMLVKLHNHPQMKANNFHVPRPLDYFADLKTILMEKVDAVRLITFLKSANRFLFPLFHQELQDIMTECGICLKVLHNINQFHPSIYLSSILENVSKTIETDYNFLTQSKILLEFHNPDLLPLIKKAIHKIGQSTLPAVITHGDYSLSNILYSGTTPRRTIGGILPRSTVPTFPSGQWRSDPRGTAEARGSSLDEHKKLYVIDFTYASENIPHRDISRFLVSLDIVNPYPKNLFFNFGNIPTFKKLFLEGYFQSLSNISELDWILIYIFKIRHLLRNGSVIFKYNADPRLKNRLYSYLARKIYSQKIEKNLSQLDRLIKGDKVKVGLPPCD